ncbi:hypothetical protein GOV14_02110, partial [Candidatus Pacearchaeota archaeon]|nr:hypothetical protein [Candidatus Pacearchaeota archaeon]
MRINTKYISIKEYDKIREKILKCDKKTKIVVDIKNRGILSELLKKKFHYLAVSFSESAREIERIKKMFLPRKIKVICKIESQKGLENLKRLIKVSEGIMVARGDLG